MPPRTSNLRGYHSQPRSIPERPRKARNFSGGSQNDSPGRRRRFSPSQSKTPPKNDRNCPTPKREIPARIEYDRNFLLSCRDSPCAKRVPMLPEIAGVTVPKQKENKEIPLSLKVKLERKGVILGDNTDGRSTETSQIASTHLPPSKTSSLDTCKRQSTELLKTHTLQSCMLHVI